MTEFELAALGLRQVGRNVKISRYARIYGAARIRVGNCVRIDDFAVLSAGAGGIDIGNHVHVAVFALAIGAERIEFADFCGVSSRSSIYSSSDDFSGDFLTGPTVAPRHTNVLSAPVRIGRHAVIGSGSTVLPGANVGDGAAVGAMSLVRSPIPDFEIHAGCPARRIGDRKRGMLDLEKVLLQDYPTDA